MARRYRAGDYRPAPPSRQFPHMPPPFDPLNFPPPFFPVWAPFNPPPPSSSHNLIHFTTQAIHAQMFVPILPRDMILERERERIRDEIMREEARRKIIEEEVRKEIAMERKSRVRNGFRHPNPNRANGPCSCNCKELPVIINLEDSDEESLPKNTTEIVDGYKGKAVSEPQLVEIQKDQFEKKAKNWVAKRNKVKAVAQPQLVDIQKEQFEKEAENWVAKRNKDKAVAQPQLEENKGQSLKKAESSEPKKGKMQKGPSKEFNCQLEQNKDQCEKRAESSGSKRKLVNLSTNIEGVKKNKKLKGPSKEFNCVICQLSSVTTELCWSSHLNGKKHKRKAEKYYADNPNLKEKLEGKNRDEKSEELNLNKESREKERAPNSDIQPEKKKILVKGEEIVVKNNRLFCESCGFNCSTRMMMEIHLGSEKHKANSEIQITQITKIS